MTKPKFEPELYVRLRDSGFSNVKIARLLGISEAAVRRGLRRVGYQPVRNSRLQELLMELADYLERHPV